MNYTWHDKKAQSNKRKHDVSFTEAATIFRDSLSMTGYDPDHSEYEDRFVSFGMSSANRLLTVSHTDENGTIRIISARLATTYERKVYEED